MSDYEAARKGDGLMTREKGLLVIPARGKALPFALLPVAEHYARELAEKGQGPVEIRSRYTGDVLAVYGEETTDE